jgi:glycosidase
MAAIRREHPGVRVVGEVLHQDPVLVSGFQDVVDTVFDFPLYFAIRKVFANRSPARELAELLSHDRLYRDPSNLVTLLGLHDAVRFMSAQGATIERLRLAFTFLLTTRGIPLIYYGDEIGMRGGADPDNRRDFPGGWPEDARSAFESTGRTTEENTIFRHVQKLLRLRSATSDLRHGRLETVLATDQQYVYRRGGMLIAINNDIKPAAVEFQLEYPLTVEDLLGSGLRLISSGGAGRVQLPARSAAIFSVNRPR